MAEVRLQFAHRNKLFRECLLAALVARNFQVREIDHEAVQSTQILSWQPDAVLIDLGLPNGTAVGLVSLFRSLSEDVKIILLVPSPNPAPQEKDALLKCIEMGVHGYVLDHASLDELTTAVGHALKGDRFCSPQILDAVFSDWASMLRVTGVPRSMESSELSAREIEVLAWVAAGLSNKQVARRLSVSLYTVKNHVHRILKKLNVDDRFAAANYARQQQWIPSGSALPDVTTAKPTSWPFLGNAGRS